MVCTRRVIELFFFVVVRTRSDGSSANPPRAIEDRRHDVKSLGRGMGVFGWFVYLALWQEDVTEGKRDRSVIIVAVFLVAVGQFSPCGSAELPALAM